MVLESCVVVGAAAVEVPGACTRSPLEIKVGETVYAERLHCGLVFSTLAKEKLRECYGKLAKRVHEWLQIMMSFGRGSFTVWKYFLISVLRQMVLDVSTSVIF